MRFLIDENVRSEVIEFLKSEGFDIKVPPSGTQDEMVAEIAKSESRVLLTHDMHFADIFQYPPEDFSGIIRVKIHPPNPFDIIEALKDLLQKLPPDKFAKRLIILERDGFRIR